MKTPAGIECKYFYGNYFRGQNREECRLLDSEWKPSLCRTCPVPAISRANSCEHMRLRLEVTHPLAAAFQARVKVIPACDKSGRTGFDGHIGCGDCHTVPLKFEVKE
jgi:hypothetical protein